jgi:hypothetical protein
MMNLDNKVNTHKDDQYLLIKIKSISKNYHYYIQGHVSNEPIFPMDESMKLYDAHVVLF